MLVELFYSSESWIAVRAGEWLIRKKHMVAFKVKHCAMILNGFVLVKIVEQNVFLLL